MQQYSHFLALYSRRTLLRSMVWGNDPIVVVGRIGRFNFFCWASSLALTLVARRWSEPFKATAWARRQESKVRTSYEHKPYNSIKEELKATYSLLNSLICHPWWGFSWSLSCCICRKECLDIWKYEAKTLVQLLLVISSYFSQEESFRSKISWYSNNDNKQHNTYKCIWP